MADVGSEAFLEKLLRGSVGEGGAETAELQAGWADEVNMLDGDTDLEKLLRGRPQRMQKCKLAGETNLTISVVAVVAHTKKTPSAGAFEPDFARERGKLRS